MGCNALKQDQVSWRSTSIFPLFNSARDWV